MAKKNPLKKLTDKFIKEVVDNAQQIIKESGHKATKKILKKKLKEDFGKQHIPQVIEACTFLYRKSRETALENFHHEITRISKVLANRYLSSQ